jgi:hypothetical protein
MLLVLVTIIVVGKLELNDSISKVSSNKLSHPVSLRLQSASFFFDKVR